MKKIGTALLMAGLVASMTGCNTAAEAATVVNKNSERLESQVKDEPESGTSGGDQTEATAKHYTYTYDQEGIKISADADVKVPETDKIPSYKVTSGELSQETVTALYDYVFGEEGGYTYTGSDQTKEWYDEAIAKRKATIAEIEADTSRTDAEKADELEMYQQSLKELEEASKTPEAESTWQMVPRDSTLQEDEQGGDLLWCDSKDESKSLFASSTAIGEGTWSNIWYSRENADYDFQHAAYENDSVVSIEEADRLGTEPIGISCTEAKKAADEIVAAAGIEAQVAQIGLAYGTCKTAPEGADSLPTADSYHGYWFSYQRVIDGYPSGVTTFSMSPENDSVVVWLYERINVCVDQDGVAWFEWKFPLQIGEKVSDHVNIISFEDSAKIFEEMEPLILKDKTENYTDSTCDIKIDKVELSLMRVRDESNTRSGMLVPAWVYYGSENSSMKGQDEGDQTEIHEENSASPWIVMAVNAVDGSVIDLEMGY